MKKKGKRVWMVCVECDVKIRVEMAEIDKDTPFICDPWCGRKVANGTS